MKRFSIFLFTILLGFDLALCQQGEITGKCTIPDAPEWVHTAVFYQIYPQTFYDSNNDGIGDLNGIIMKLDYVKSLGANAIWLNPFFDSPFNDGGYDIRDYYKVAQRYGTNEDAKRLFAEAHKRGIKVIFDYVITYTAIDHPWFIESCKGTPNKFTNWYIWTDNVWKEESGEFANRFIQGYGHRNGNFMRNFYWCQPALNFGFGKPDSSKHWQLPTTHPDVLAMKEELKKVFCYWMDMGADGIRADMAGALVKGEDIHGETKQFWKEIRQIMKEKYPQGFMVSEWSYPKDALDAFHADFFHWFDGYNDLTQKESWRILNGFSEGHSFFDKEGKGNIAHFLANYLDQYSATKAKGYILLPLGNHDNARMNTNRTTDELEMIMAFGITMPGIPFIYYGNEIGMRQLSDMPQIEGAYKPRSGARTPMQWSLGKNRGFSSAEFSQLYLPVDTSSDAPNVESEQQDPHSLLHRVKKLIDLKHNEPALAAYAEFVPLYAKENTYPFVYARANGKDIILAIFNPSERPVSIECSFHSSRSKFQLIAGTAITLSKKRTTISMDIPGVTYALYKVK
jgi:maltose alpha-D-glucosyltransferase/alpha-amylase